MATFEEAVSKAMSRQNLHIKMQVLTELCEIQQVSTQNYNFQQNINNEWQDNESEINVCLGKLPLFIHVSS